MSVARVRGLEIGYDEVGQGPPLVMLHGFPLNRSMWDEQAAAWGAKYRVITPDLRGHGHTTVSNTVTMEEMAEDVAALMDELKIDERVVIGGLSMGGYVTFAFYRLFPDRVRGLILADTRPQADTEEARRNREELARRALNEGIGPVVDSFLPKIFAPATPRERPEAVERVRQMMIQTKPEGAAAALRAMAVRRDQTDLLPEILSPTLVIVGSEDALTPPKEADLMHRGIRGSRLEIMEGAGHASNIERPAQFSRAVTEFLDELEP